MPCNTPVLLPPLVCVLWSKIYSMFGHCLLCLTEGHPKRALGPQQAPLSQTLIGERFHQVLRRNSPDTARWQRFRGNIIRGSCENDQPCSMRGWSQLVTPRTPRNIFPCDHAWAIIAPKTPKHQLENATFSSEVTLIGGGTCVLPSPTADSGCSEAKKGREGKNRPLNGINLNRITGTATRWFLKAE